MEAELIERAYGLSFPHEQPEELTTKGVKVIIL
jgi:hypothetical protein